MSIVPLCRKKFQLAKLLFLKPEPNMKLSMGTLLRNESFVITHRAEKRWKEVFPQSLRKLISSTGSKSNINSEVTLKTRGVT